LFDEFLRELLDELIWQGELGPWRFNPGRKLRRFVDGVGAAAAPLLLDALSLRCVEGYSAFDVELLDRDLRSWACVGLGWLGPAAGDAAVAVLVEHVRMRRDPLAEAAVALDAIAPARARELGVHRWPETMGPLIDRYVEQGIDALVEYVEWFVAGHADEDVVRFLGRRTLRDRLGHDCPARAVRLLRALVRGTAI
jgi:hypothetical protein